MDIIFALSFCIMLFLGGSDGVYFPYLNMIGALPCLLIHILRSGSDDTNENY